MTEQEIKLEIIKLLLSSKSLSMAPYNKFYDELESKTNKIYKIISPSN